MTNLLALLEIIPYGDTKTEVRDHSNYQYSNIKTSFKFTSLLRLNLHLFWPIAFQSFHYTQWLSLLQSFCQYFALYLYSVIQVKLVNSWSLIRAFFEFANVHRDIFVYLAANHYASMKNASTGIRIHCLKQKEQS